MSALVTDAAVLAAIDALQLRYIEALDEKDMDAWLATFAKAPDSAYYLTTRENHDDGLPLGLVHDDCHARLQDRVNFVTRIWAGVYQDYQPRHFVQRLRCEAVAGAAGEYDVKSNFSMIFTPSDSGRTQVFTAGVYLDRVVIGADGTAAFKTKRVVNDSRALEQYLVYPV